MDILEKIYILLSVPLRISYVLMRTIINISEILRYSELISSIRNHIVPVIGINERIL